MGLADSHDQTLDLQNWYAKPETSMGPATPSRAPLDWECLRVFLAACDAGSFAGAARALGLGQASVARRLAALEAAVGGPLFRLERGRPVPTALGQALGLNLDGLSDRLREASEAARHADDQLRGLIRVTTTDTLLQGLLAPHLARFRAAHPGITLRVSIQNPFFNLARREADVAIRGSNHPPGNLIGRLVGRIQTAPYAAASYLGGRSPPWLLPSLDWIAPDDSLSHLEQARWLATQVPPDRIVARMDSLVGMAEAVAAGLGAGMLLRPLAERRPGLVPLAPADPALDTQIWVLSHPELRQVARIRALTTFLYESLRADPALEH